VANDLSANPWKLDTAGAGTIYSFPIKITNIIWANYTTTGDALVIRDKNGKDIVNALITTSLGGQISFGAIGWVEGIALITITHGEVTIAIGAGK
jgi:hypothetical protein